MKKLFIFATVLLFNCGNAQIAEQLFKEEYSKVGLEVITHLMYSNNTKNIAAYKWVPSQSLGIGATYNFYQKKNLNLKVAVFFSMFDLNTTYTATNSINIQQTIFNVHGQYALFSAPIDAEYYFKINSNTLFSVQAGPKITVNHYGLDEGRTVSGTNNTSVETIDFSKKFPVFIGVNVGASVSFLSKSALVKLNVKYHRSLSDFIYKGNSTITVNSVDSFSTQLLTGNYLGFGLSIFPHKELFNF